MESSFFIRASLSDEEMQVGMKVDTFPEGLDDGNDPRGYLLKS